MDIRLMLPTRRDDPPEWELSHEGHVVGWIKQTRIGRSSVTFYQLHGVHPETGQKINLELSADFDERVRVLEQFLDDPSSMARHMPFGYRSTT